MRNESVNTPTTTNPLSEMKQDVLTTIPASDPAGIFAMLREYVRQIAKEVFHELMDEMRHLHHPPIPKENTDHMDLQDAIEFLNSRGYRISAAKIYKLTSKNEIPFQKIDGSNRLHFYRSQLEEWLNLKLIDGNAIGILDFPTNHGGRR